MVQTMTSELILKPQSYKATRLSSNKFSFVLFQIQPVISILLNTSKRISNQPSYQQRYFKASQANTNQTKNTMPVIQYLSEHSQIPITIPSTPSSPRSLPAALLRFGLSFCIAVIILLLILYAVKKILAICENIRERNESNDARTTPLSGSREEQDYMLWPCVDF